MKGVRQTGRDTCYFCGSEGPIETHHIVPRRYEGSDDEENLVDLCPTCHERLERLYTDDTFEAVRRVETDDDVVDAEVDPQTTQMLLYQAIASPPTDGYEWGRGPTTDTLVELVQAFGVTEAVAWNVLETGQKHNVIVEIPSEGGEQRWMTGDEEIAYDRLDKHVSAELLEWCYSCDDTLAYDLPNRTECSNCGVDLVRQRELVANDEWQYSDLKRKAERENDPVSDMDSEFIETGIQSERDSVTNIKQIVADVESRHSAIGAPVEEVVNRAKDEGSDEDQARHELERLKQKAEIYEPQEDLFRTT